MKLFSHLSAFVYINNIDFAKTRRISNDKFSSLIASGCTSKVLIQIVLSYYPRMGLIKLSNISIKNFYFNEPCILIPS